MKHKHYDLIVAWANGAEIEARYEKATGWTDWKTEDGGFVWYIGGAEYRIKPEPKPDVVKYFYAEAHPLLGLRFSTFAIEDLNTNKHFNVIKTFWDGETSKLKSAEVIK